MTPADLAQALDRERARTAHLRTLLAHRNALIDDLLPGAPRVPVQTMHELVDVLARALREGRRSA